MTPQRLLDLVRSTADPAFAVDHEGVIVAWNAAAAGAFGIAEDEAVKHLCAHTIRGGDECGPVCSTDCTVQQLVGARRPVRNFDLLVPTPRGRQWYNFSVLIYAEVGSPDAFGLHVARLVDTQKRLETLVRDFVRTEVPDSGGTSVNRTAISNAALSEREIEVLHFLAQGLTTSEVATELGISRTTVNNHVQHAMTKLSAHTRLEAIRKAEFGGLI
jgi:DNA-binding CsgD family transcriptional regulator